MMSKRKQLYLRTAGTTEPCLLSIHDTTCPRAEDTLTMYIADQLDMFPNGEDKVLVVGFKTYND